MPTFGMVVEGDYDVKALTEIIRKCLPEQINIISRPLNSRLMQKFPGHLEEFRWANKGSPCDKALVIRDADNKNTNELKERMQNKIEGRLYDFEVKFVVIVQELETWLLADERAISDVTYARTGRTVRKVRGNLETLRDPKRKLEQILSKAKVDYTPEVAREIAGKADPDIILSRCPRFECFVNAVTDS